MTYSSAWIEPGNDEDFATFLKQSPRFGVLPPPPSPYWINHVKAWAARESLAIEHPDHGEIRVAVTKQQLLRFLDENFGVPESDADPSSLRGHIERQLRDDRTYAIAADEF
jgi:hypothetical protein